MNSKHISPIATKLLGCKRLCNQLTLRNHTQPCRLAKLAGCLLDLAKGAVNLPGIPKILMQVAGTMAQHGWYTYLQKPKLLKGLLHQAKLELTRIQPFLVTTTPQPIKVYLTTDACDYGWGGTLQVETKYNLGPCFKAHQMFTPWRGSDTSPGRRPSARPAAYKHCGTEYQGAPTSRSPPMQLVAWQLGTRAPASHT